MHSCHRALLLAFLALALLALPQSRAWSADEDFEDDDEGECVMRADCYDSHKDSDCHPTILITTSEIACKQYANYSCCNENANQKLLDNFNLIDSTFSNYCPSCGHNIVMFYCEVICSPHQHKWVQPIGYANVTDPVNGYVVTTVTQVNVTVHPSIACQLYDSCKTTPNAKLSPNLGASATNFFNYQSMNAIGDGQQMFFNYEEENSVQYEVLPCYNYTDPTTGLQKSCPCTSCQDTCNADMVDGGTHVVPEISVIDGFDWIPLLISLGAFVVIFVMIEILRSIKCLKPRKTVDEVQSNVDIVNPELPSWSARLFDWYSKFCVKHPIWLMIVPLVVTGAFCLFNINLELESDPNQIWVNPSSRIYKQKQVYNEMYGPFYRLQQAFFSFDNPVNGTVLNKEYLLELSALQKRLMSMNDSAGTSFQDICYKPLQGKGCMIQSPLQFWRNNDEDLLNDDNIPATVSCASYDVPPHRAFPPPSRIEGVLPCFSDIGVPVQAEVVLGWKKNDRCVANATNGDPCDGCIARADKLVISILLSIEGRPEQMFSRWEKEVMIHIFEEQNALHKAGKSTMSVTYMAERSISDDIVDATKANILIIALSYLAMFVYIFLALGKFPHPVYSRVALSTAGILGVLLSTGVAFAFCAMMKYSVTLIVTDVLPFLLLAIGVDSLFIIVKDFDHQISNKIDINEKICERLHLTLSAVTPSITSAVICEIFCISATVALIVNYILIYTFFVGCLVLDTRRQELFRIDCLCCVKAPPKYSQLRQSRLSEIGKENTNIVIHDIVNAENEATDGSLKTTARGDYIRRSFNYIVIPVFTSILGKIVLFALFLLFTISSLFGLFRLELGLDQTIVLPSDSELQGYFSDLYTYGRTGSMAYILMKDIDYTDPKVEEIIQKMQSELESNKYVVHPVQNWVNSYRIFLHANDSTGGDCPPIPSDISGVHFYEVLSQYVKIAMDDFCCIGTGFCGGQYWEHVTFRNDSEGHITGLKNSRLMFQHSPLVTQNDFIMAVRSMELIADVYNEEYRKYMKSGPEVEVFVPYGMFYVYFGQYDDVLAQLFLGFFITCFAISLCSLVITNRTVALLTFGTVFFTVIDVVGVQHWWNCGTVQINAIFLVTILNSMGLSVEFIVHIASAYYRGWGSREERIKNAVLDMGSRVFGGIALTKICGLVVLAFAPERVFTLYFFRVYIMVVLFGTFHGLYFFPSLLHTYARIMESRGQGTTRSSFTEGISAPLITKQEADSISQIAS